MLILGGLSLGLAVGMVWGRSPGLVEWCRARAVCIESDDWGLCGFLPDSSAIAAMDREALAPGHFPDVYWHSTLEDSAMVAELAAVLKAHVGRDGLLLQLSGGSDAMISIQNIVFILDFV